MTKFSNELLKNLVFPSFQALVCFQSTLQYIRSRDYQDCNLLFRYKYIKTHGDKEITFEFFKSLENI